MSGMAKRVLLVEAEPDVARLLTFNLEQAGYDVSHVERGLDALARARAELPVVMVLDVMLPDMTGFDVCRRTVVLDLHPVVHADRTSATGAGIALSAARTSNDLVD